MDTGDTIQQKPTVNKHLLTEHFRTTVRAAVLGNESTPSDQSALRIAEVGYKASREHISIISAVLLEDCGSRESVKKKNQRGGKEVKGEGCLFSTFSFSRFFPFPS